MEFVPYPARGACGFCRGFFLGGIKILFGGKNFPPIFLNWAEKIS
jgi:hypothetical protein